MPTQQPFVQPDNRDLMWQTRSQIMAMTFMFIINLIIAIGVPAAMWYFDFFNLALALGVAGFGLLLAIIALSVRASASRRMKELKNNL